jgi:hypothetical protein
MRCIGFSTGALARDDFRQALQMLADKDVNAVELSALRQHELAPLVEQLGQLELANFQYISFHAPSAIERSFEPIALDLLSQVAARNWPIIVHPDAMSTPRDWASLGDCLCIENMDKRKPAGQTAKSLAEIFQVLPNASLCFDIGHARQVDPTMSEAWEILQRFRDKIKQLHVSEVNTQSKHDPISLESVLAFQKVSHLLPAEAPIILESRVQEPEINGEVQSALAALTAPTTVYAFNEPAIKTVYEAEGVYGLAQPASAPNQYTILYVGKCSNLRERLKYHLNYPPVPGITHFFVERIENEERRTLRERQLIGEFKPTGIPHFASKGEGTLVSSRATNNYNHGLDDRRHDADGEVRRKRSDTLVGTLRSEYGEDFAKGLRSDAHPATVLRDTGSNSASNYLKRRR